jgi:pyrimidine-specific ribonucleoside hydrolase
VGLRFPVIREDGAVPIPVILDVDTGVDDALAPLFAAAHPELDASCSSSSTRSCLAAEPDRRDAAAGLSDLTGAGARSAVV